MRRICVLLLVTGGAVIPVLADRAIRLAAPPGSVPPPAGGPRAVLWEQPYDGVSEGAAAQEFPDDLSYSTYEFDAITVDPPGWRIATITIFGEELGIPALNDEVLLGLATAPDYEAIGPIFQGMQVGADLVFDLGDFQLPPGTWWVSAWVLRDFTLGGQWFWFRTLPVSGGEHMFHNPGGGFGYGPAPLPGSVVFGSAADLAFRIEGELVSPPGGGLVCADPNCDGVIDAFDIDPFVLALTDPAGYAAAFPGCDISTADVNGDGAVDAFDIDPFVAALVGGSCCEQALSDAVADLAGSAAFSITSYSVSFVDTFTAANRDALLDMIVSDGYLPILDASDPTNLQVGKIPDDPSIPAASVAAYRSFLDSSAPDGTELLMVAYDSPSAGTFSTFALCTGGHVVFEPMLSLITRPWPPTPPPGPLPTTCSGREIYENWFGVDVLSFDCCAHAKCRQGQVVGCDSTHEAMGLAVGWVANGTDQHEIQDNCCHAKCNFGYASGFKSVKIAADGVSVEIEGNLGCGGTFSRVADDCCQSRP